jgi:hypothetical protein
VRLFPSSTSVRVLITGAVICAGSLPSVAQYIEPVEGLPIEPRFVSLGASWWNFAPLGSNVLPDSSAIRFNRVAPTLAYHDGQLDIAASYTTYAEGGESHPAIYFGGKFGQEIPLSGPRSAALTLPISALVEFTKVEANGLSRQTFNVGDIGLGAGLKYRSVSRTMQFWVEGGGVAALAFDAYSLGNGFCGAAYAEAALLIGDVGPFKGIALIYRFRWQSWSMSDHEFNYSSLVHGPELGVVF